MKKENNIVAQDICMVCGEIKSIAISKYLNKNIPERICTGPELCDKCLKKMKDENKFVLYEADPKPNGIPEFTGRYAIINFDTINSDYPDYKFVDKNRFLLMTSDEFKKLEGDINESRNKS